MLFVYRLKLAVKDVERGLSYAKAANKWNVKKIILHDFKKKSTQVLNKQEKRG